MLKVSQGADPFERWPGYNEQSWSQRFAELDRQFADLREDMPNMLVRYVTTARKQVLEEAAKVAEVGVPYVVGEQRDLCDRLARSIRALGSQNDG